MPDSASSDRLVPQNLEAERALLGSILLDNSVLPLVIEGVKKDDFFSEAHRLIFETTLALSAKSRTVDLVTISDELTKKGLIEKAGGDAYLAGLTDGVPIGNTVALADYIRIVKDKSILRKLINASNNVIWRCQEGAEDPDALIDLAQSQIFKIAESQAPTGFVNVREIMKLSFGTLDELLDRGSRVTGVPTGFKDLDDMTSGLQPGELVVVAARPSLGKTALALNIAAHAAIKHGKTVGFFSLEMSKESLVIRLLCAEADTDSHRLRSGSSNREEWKRLTNALGRLGEAPLFIEDAAALTVTQIRAKARRLQIEKGLDLVVVDYLQLVAGQDKTENRTQEVTKISHGLKALAKELKVPVLALSQLSRAPEQRQGRPQLSDLRESGSIEQDADVVIFLYREPKKASQEEQDGDGDRRGREMKLIVGKQRNGPTGDISVVFMRPFAKFENLDHSSSAPGQ
jgi:replicative DNA helicase